MSEISSGILLLLGFFGLIYLAWRFLLGGAYTKSLIVILILGLQLRIIGASDPYLHAWDERYHALVAKNMMDHPFKPTLHEHPVLAYENENWVGGNIWLAKPVFPLLLMSGSLKIFGVNLFGVRFISIGLGVLAIFLTFLIGRRLFNEKVGIIAAFLHAIQGSLIELAGGRISSDHVEMCFLVMVQLGIYFALRRFNRNGTNGSIFLAGIFMGLAFLSKWYPGLLVLPVWAIFFYTYHGKNTRQFLIQLGLLLVGFSVIALPWTLYMLQEFPKEMGLILTNAAAAYSETVEFHSKPFSYYFLESLWQFGELILIPFIYFGYAGWKNKANFRYWPILVWICIPLLIFSFADTKRFTYLLISAPAFFILLAAFWIKLKENEFKFVPKWLRVSLLIALIALPFRYGIERTKIFGNKSLIPNFYNLSSQELALIDDKTIIFGTDDYIEFMFHTPCYAAYRQVPSQTELQEFMEQGYKVITFKHD